MDEVTRRAAMLEIVEKRNAIVAERERLRKQRAELSARERELDRELADCRAAARVFKLDVEFPPDERDAASAGSFVWRTLRSMNSVLSDVGSAPSDHQRVLFPMIAGHRAEDASKETPATQSRDIPTPAMPRLRDIVLDRLQREGTRGSKAAPIRDYIERTYERRIHEKSVGMTLFRLAQEGLVRREGRTWFFIPQNAETKNPGAVTPGSTQHRE